MIRFIQLFTDELTSVFDSALQSILFPIRCIISTKIWFLYRDFAILWFSFVKFDNYIFRFIRNFIQGYTGFWIVYVILKSCSASVERKEFSTAMVAVKSYFLIFLSMQSVNNLFTFLDISCFRRESIRWSRYLLIIGLILTKDAWQPFAQIANFYFFSFKWQLSKTHHYVYHLLCCPF